MRIVAITNIKGGVGKTTTAVNLGFVAAQSGLRTVLWDLDAQGGATYALNATPLVRAKAKHLVRGEQELTELVQPTGYANLDLMAADASYRHFDRLLGERKRPAERLLKMSRVLREHYDLLLLDCPPGVSLLTESVLRAADLLVVPVIPAPLSLRMLEELAEFVRAQGWTDLPVLPVFSMVDRRRALHLESIAAGRGRFPETLHAEIPYWSEIERMSARRAPVPAYAPASEAAGIYVSLWAEIAGRLGFDPG